MGLLSHPGPMLFSPLVGPELAVCSHGETQRGRGESTVCAMIVLLHFWNACSSTLGNNSARNLASRAGWEQLC